MLLCWVILLLIAVVISGDFFLRGALEISKRFKIPPFILGVTVVAIGTSAPDLFLSSISSIKGFHDISVAAIVGSGIVNILIGIGIAALIGKVLYDKTETAVRFGMLYNTIFIILFVLGLSFTQGKIGLPFGILLLAASIFFIIINITFLSEEEDEIDLETYNPKKFIISIIFFAGGLIGLSLFSDLLLKCIITASDELMIPKKVIASSVIGFGNSLPEIVTSVIAIIRKRSKIIIGNIIGSNIFIIGGVLGIVSIITNLKTGTKMEIILPSLVLDIPFLLFSSLLLFVCFKIKSSIGKITGLIFIFMYLIYTLLQLNII